MQKERKQASVRCARDRCFPPHRNIIHNIFFSWRVCFWRKFVVVAMHWRALYTYKWHTWGTEPLPLLLLLFFCYYYFAAKEVCSVRCVSYFFYFVHVFVICSSERLVLAFPFERIFFTNNFACLLAASLRPFVHSFATKREKGLAVCACQSLFLYFALSPVDCGVGVCVKPRRGATLVTMEKWYL